MAASTATKTADTPKKRMSRILKSAAFCLLDVGVEASAKPRAQDLG